MLLIWKAYSVILDGRNCFIRVRTGVQWMYSEVMEFARLVLLNFVDRIRQFRMCTLWRDKCRMYSIRIVINMSMLIVWLTRMNMIWRTMVFISYQWWSPNSWSMADDLFIGIKQTRTFVGTLKKFNFCKNFLRMTKKLRHTRHKTRTIFFLFAPRSLIRRFF